MEHWLELIRIIFLIGFTSIVALFFLAMMALFFFRTFKTAYSDVADEHKSRRTARKGYNPPPDLADIAPAIPPPSPPKASMT